MYSKMKTPTSFFDDTPPARMMRPLLGAVSEKGMLLQSSKARGIASAARADRWRGRKSVAEENVDLTRKLTRARP